MEKFFLYSAVVLTIIIAIPLIRVVKGPTIFDRLLATNAIATKTIVLICLIGVLAIAKYFSSPKVRRNA